MLLEPPDDGLLPLWVEADELPLWVLLLCRGVGRCDGAAVVGADEGEAEADGAAEDEPGDPCDPCPVGDCEPPLG